MNKTKRIVSTLLAVIMGILIINLLTHVGNQAKGPLEDFFVKAGDVVTDAEAYLLNEKAERYKRLQGFSAHRSFAQLERPDKILLGAFDNQSRQDFQSIMALEASLNTTFPLIHIYTAWGSKPEQRFPLMWLKAIHELGSVPVLTWEPWLVDFDQTAHPELGHAKERDKNGLKAIARGEYDFYLSKWVADLAQFEHPLFIRWGHEMNDPYRYPWGPQHNEPADFVAAWRHVVNFFRRANVGNVLWVWSPHIAYGSFDAYYPGHDYVDWIGLGTLNYGTVASWSRWWSFDEIFGTHYPELARFGKPILLSEFGSLAVGGDRAEWYRSAFCAIPQKYPAVKAILFFHFNEDNTLTYQMLDWYFKEDSSIIAGIVDCMAMWPDSLHVK